MMMNTVVSEPTYEEILRTKNNILEGMYFCRKVPEEDRRYYTLEDIIEMEAYRDMSTSEKREVLNKIIEECEEELEKTGYNPHFTEKPSNFSFERILTP